MIASGTSIAGYAGLLLGGRTILHGKTNNSLRVDCFRYQYRRVLLGGRTILHGITNNSLRVDCIKNQYRRVHKVTGTILHGITNSSFSGLIASGTSIAGYTGLLLGERTILSGIANSSPRVDCFRNQYHQVLLGGRTVLHGITNNSLRVDTSITGYC